MGVLREVEGQDEGFGAGVLDFHAAVAEGGLGDEADLGIEFAEFHVLVVSHCELSDPSGSAIGVEKGGAVGAESGLVARGDGETEDGGLLVAKEIAVDNPLCVDPVA